MTVLEVEEIDEHVNTFDKSLLGVDYRVVAEIFESELVA